MSKFKEFIHDNDELILNQRGLVQFFLQTLPLLLAKGDMLEVQHMSLES